MFRTGLAAALCVSLVACSKETNQGRVVPFTVAGYPGRFEASFDYVSRSCFWIECGESTSKIVDQYYSFRYIEDGAVRTFPLIRCDRYSHCGADVENFKFCGDYFVPVAHQDVFDVGGKSASAVDCKRGAIIQAI